MTGQTGDATQVSLTGAGLADDDPRSWRARLLQGLLWSSVAVYVSVGSFSVAHPIGGYDVRVFVLGGVLTLSLALAGRRVPYSLRAAGLLLAVTASTVYGVTLVGYAPNAFSSFGFVTVAATLLFGVRAGIGLVLLLASMLLLVPGLQRAGVIVRVDGWARLLDSAEARGSQ